MTRHDPPIPNAAQTSTVMWELAHELDRLAGTAPGAVTVRALAFHLRVGAITGALDLDGIPAMSEGWVLAPHPLKIRQAGTAGSGEACAESAHFVIERDLEPVIRRFYLELDTVVRGCTQGNAGAAPVHKGRAACLPCIRWAERFLAGLTVTG